jgi:hypothetical protein
VLPVLPARYLLLLCLPVSFHRALLLSFDVLQQQIFVAALSDSIAPAATRKIFSILLSLAVYCHFFVHIYMYICAFPSLCLMLSMKQGDETNGCMYYIRPVLWDYGGRGSGEEI